VSELAELYALFLALYLFECVAFVPRGTVGFFALVGRWRAHAAFRPNPSWSFSAVLGKPWPPLTPPWLAQALPFAVDPSGITATGANQRRLAWEELDPFVARAARVESGQRLSYQLASRRAAASLAAMLERIRAASPAQRQAEIRGLLDASFDVDGATTGWRAFARSVLPLRVLSNALWLSLFVGMGLAVLAQDTSFLLVAAVLTLLLWPIQAVVFARTLRKQTWLARAHWPDLGKRLVAMVSPLSAVRAVDMLARELWANLDPVAVAAVLLAPRDLAALARPRLVAVQPRDADSLGWWRAQVRAQIELVLRRRNLSVDDLLAPPRREGPPAALYCPACLAQYQSAASSDGCCPNQSCHDIRLRAFVADQP
jgi:hypothetical protein